MIVAGSHDSARGEPARRLGAIRPISDQGQITESSSYTIFWAKIEPFICF